MCRRGQSPDLAHVALKAELCQESLGQWLAVRDGRPGPGQGWPGWPMAGAFSSPQAGLGSWGVMLLLLLCRDTVQGAKGRSWPCSAQQLGPGGEKGGLFRHLLV